VAPKASAPTSLKCIWASSSVENAHQRFEATSAMFAIGTVEGIAPTGISTIPIRRSPLNANFYVSELASNTEKTLGCGVSVTFIRPCIPTTTAPNCRGRPEATPAQQPFEGANGLREEKPRRSSSRQPTSCRADLHQHQELCIRRRMNFDCYGHYPVDARGRDLDAGMRAATYGAHRSSASMSAAIPISDRFRFRAPRMNDGHAGRERKAIDAGSGGPEAKTQ
jgi:hypothetical protein